MIQEECVKKAAKIAEYYGFRLQREMLIEECSELIQAVQKYKRIEGKACFPENTTAARHYVEELADVAIMIEQMLVLLRPEHREIFDDMIKFKLDRQLERIEENRLPWEKNADREEKL